GRAHGRQWFRHRLQLLRRGYLRRLLRLYGGWPEHVALARWAPYLAGGQLDVSGLQRSSMGADDIRYMVPKRHPWIPDHLLRRRGWLHDQRSDWSTWTY